MVGVENLHFFLKTGWNTRSLNANVSLHGYFFLVFLLLCVKCSVCQNCLETLGMSDMFLRRVLCEMNLPLY